MDLVEKYNRNEAHIMFYYSKVDDITTTHSRIVEENGMDVVYVYFERPNTKGFDFAKGKIPNFAFDQTFGFSEDELLHLIQYMKNNSALIWEFAAKGGGENA